MALIGRFVVFAVALIFLPRYIQVSVSNPLASKSQLRFNTNGKFKILNFADLHYGESTDLPHGRAKDSNSTRVMKTLLEYEHPDFVVFTGDLMSADNIKIKPTRFIDACFQSVDELGYKWASTYGNHDHGIAMRREEVFQTESKYLGSYTQHGPQDILGITNFYLPIYAQAGGKIPLLILWFFDSRGGFDPDRRFPATVDVSVVNWFKIQDAKLKAKWGQIPALAFFHIPTLEYEDVQAKMEEHRCNGLVDEPVVPQEGDTGFMDALLGSNVMTTFVGHDHNNSWCCDYKNLEICYNRRTGYGGYGNWDRGARVVEIDSKNPWTGRRNYVRLENGSIVDEFISRP